MKEGNNGVVEKILCVEWIVSRREDVKFRGNVGGACPKGK